MKLTPGRYVLDIGSASPAGDNSDHTVMVRAGEAVKKNLYFLFHSTATSSATAAALVPLRPTALAVGPNGDLFIADPTRNQILERHSDGTFTVFAGTGTAGFQGDGGPAVDAEIDRPSGMVFATDGTLDFADEGNSRVRSISPQGTMRTVVGNGEPGATGFVASGTAAVESSPLSVFDVTFGPDGRLYVATGAQVLRLNADGTLTSVVGVPGIYQGVYGVGGPAVRGSADGVDGMAFDASGDLWMFGFNTKAILMVTPNGTLTEPAADQSFYPRGNGGLVTTPNGSVIAMNELSVERITPSAPQTIIAFNQFHGIRGFSPNGIAVSRDGTIYVDTYYGDGFADRSAIASISPDGTASQVLWESTDQPVATLSATGVNTTRFGDSQSTVYGVFDHLFGTPNATMTFRDRTYCSVDAITRWREVSAYFSHGRFVGYRSLGSSTRYTTEGGAYFGGAGQTAQTDLGLRVGDTLALAQSLYGLSLTTSAAQGGGWIVTTPDGVIQGYLSGVPGHASPYQLLIESIGAGDVGCPAESP